jgi:hypothetical protein
VPDDIEDSAARAPELNAEVSSLNGDFLHGIGDAESLLRAGQPDVVVLGSIQQVVIAAGPLAVDGKSSAVVLKPGPNSAARRLSHAG